jgi:hypothetical protein
VTLAVVLLFAIGAPASAEAQVLVANGPVQVKGKRWVDGVETAVNCKAKSGHLLRVTNGERFFFINPAPACSIFDDGVATPPGTYHGLLFEGPELQVTKNDKLQRRTTLVGFETFVDDVDGALSSSLRLDDTGGAKSDSGSIAYVRIVDGHTIVFVGRYRAKLGG